VHGIIKPKSILQADGTNAQMVAVIGEFNAKSESAATSHNSRQKPSSTSQMLTLESIIARTRGCLVMPKFKDIKAFIFEPIGGRRTYWD
jgi:hypothetical protein